MPFPPTFLETQCLLCESAFSAECFSVARGDAPERGFPSRGLATGALQTKHSCWKLSLPGPHQCLDIYANTSASEVPAKRFGCLLALDPIIFFYFVQHSSACTDNQVLFYLAFYLQQKIFEVGI